MEDLMKYLEDNVSRNSQMIKTFFVIAIEKNDSTAIQRLIENGVSVNLPLDDFRSSPLHIAVQNAQLDVVKLLLEHHQTDIHAVDGNGQTVLHLASSISTAILSVLQPSEPGQTRTIKFLREEVTSIQDRSLEIIRLLINRGCNVNAKDRNGFTPLYKIFYDPSIRFIKAKMADAGDAVLDKQRIATIRRLKTLVIDLVRAKQSQKLKLLLDHGADVEMRFDDTEDTILHVVIGDLETSRDFEQFENVCFVDGSHAEMIKEILDLKLVDVNVKNKEGTRPIDMAVSLLSADIVRVLVNHGADLSSQSSVVINGFVYPRAPPCLDAVENLIDIVAMRRNTGSPLSSDETLAVLKFFIAYSFDTYGGDYDASRKFREFLEFGTEDVIIRTLEKIIKKIPRYSKFMVIFIVSESNKYLLNMRACDLRISRKVESLLKVINSRVTVFNKRNDGALKRLMLEGYKMKMLKIINDKSLRDILNLPPNEMYSYLKNYEYKESLRTHYFFTSSIIKGFFTRCLIRRFAVEIANDNLRLALTTSLPDSCCEAISKYLTNWDLLNLFKATSIPPKTSKTPRDAFAVLDILPDLSEEFGIILKAMEMRIR